jgi:hypothetical protein
MNKKAYLVIMVAVTIMFFTGFCVALSCVQRHNPVILGIAGCLFFIAFVFFVLLTTAFWGSVDDE